MKLTHVNAEAAGALDGGSGRGELAVVGGALRREGELVSPRCNRHGCIPSRRPDRYAGVTRNRREVQPAAAGDEEAVRREREVEERHGCVWRERDARPGCEVAAGEYVYVFR